MNGINLTHFTLQLNFGHLVQVVNIGDTVSVISEVGLDRGEGKRPEDFLYDPFERSSSEDWSSSDDMEDDEYEHRSPHFSTPKSKMDID